MYVTCEREQCVVKYSYGHLLADTLVSEVEVWLLLEELVKVALSSNFIVSP